MSRDAHAIRLASGLLFMKSTIRERSTCKNTFIVRCLDSWFLQRYSASRSDAWRDSRSFLHILCVCVCACVRVCVCISFLHYMSRFAVLSLLTSVRPTSFLHTHPRSRSLSCVHRGHFLYSLTLSRSRDDWSTLFLHARRLPLLTTSIYGVACAHVAAPHTSSGER